MTYENFYSTTEILKLLSTINCCQQLFVTIKCVVFNIIVLYIGNRPTITLSDLMLNLLSGIAILLVVGYYIQYCIIIEHIPVIN